MNNIDEHIQKDQSEIEAARAAGDMAKVRHLEEELQGLKEYKEHRAKEVVVLKEKRKQKERERGARRDEKERPPSPRINAAEQLAKAYELALQIARGGAKSRPQDQLECAPD